jgi:hypothetical protein
MDKGKKRLQRRPLLFGGASGEDFDSSFFQSELDSIGPVVVKGQKTVLADAAIPGQFIGRVVVDA